MAWQCPWCGTENWDVMIDCIGCDVSRAARRLVLESENLHKSLRMHISTTVGRALLKSIAGEEAVYASDPQFEVIKDEATGIWRIRHLPSAKNRTYYNGVPLGTEAVPIETSGVVSIGAQQMRLLVRLEH